MSDSVEEVLSQLRDEVGSAIHAFKGSLGRLRTGRANLSLLDGIRVSYYGSMTPLAQCAQLSVADGRMITIKAWDKGLIGEIEKAILNASELGITPQNDGEMIRLPIPPLTEERRKALVKQAKGKGEEARISLRNHRREANEFLKSLEKDKEISEDDLRRALEKVQGLVDQGVKDVEGVLKEKEAEILEV